MGNKHNTSETFLWLENWKPISMEAITKAASTAALTQTEPRVGEACKEK